MLLPNVAEITPETIAQDNEPPAQSVINSNNAYTLTLTEFDSEITFTIDIMHDSTISASNSGAAATGNDMANIIEQVSLLIRENTTNINITNNE